MDKRISIFNETGQTTGAALLGLLRKAFSRDYRVLIDLPCRDYVGGRAERTKALRSVEVELFGDGSGVEVAFCGLRCMFGVKERIGGCCGSY